MIGSMSHHIPSGMAMLIRFFRVLIGPHVLTALIALSVVPPDFLGASEKPDAWELRRSMIVNLPRSHPAAPYMPDLIRRLISAKGAGLPVSEAEFLALFDKPESRKVYGGHLVRLATPRSVVNQNKAHRDYSRTFMAEKRVKRGVLFLRNKKNLLDAAENEYGVFRKDIVSILMWESGLGEFTGNLRVFNVLVAQLLYLEEAQQEAIRQIRAKGDANPLASPALVIKQEKRFAKIRRRCVGNLVALLRQSKAKGVDPLSLTGSWAGAIGYPQFMPASMSYAADGDGDGKIDLHSWPDAVMSVAKYLKERGNYGPTDSQRRKAIFSYNPLDSYVNGVIKYADAIWEQR